MNTEMIMQVVTMIFPVVVEVIFAIWFINVLNDIRSELRKANKREEDKMSREWYAAHNRNAQGDQS